MLGHVESFTDAERAALEPYFTNVDRPVFAMTNLPEVVKGALFARYSRSAKSLRRLFLDEFLDEVAGAEAGKRVGTERADKLFDRVFVEYGDDSVAQLGGVHLACEYVSNVQTKVLEWGRLMAYLEQSTRYVPYDDRLDGQWKYTVPPELDGHPLRGEYTAAMDFVFETYARMLAPMVEHYQRLHPRDAGVSKGAYIRTIRAKALDSIRGLLPASTYANVGIYGTGQAYEALLLRMRAHPSAEVRGYAEMMLVELRKVIPAFLKRVDQQDRGVVWTEYLGSTRDATATVAAALLHGQIPEPQAEVSLTDFDAEGEIKVVAAALYASSDLSDRQLQEIARGFSVEQRSQVLQAYIGDRKNRRHKPGRAFERTSYRFDVLADYGAFRDLQRHRMLTLDWQALSTAHGYNVAAAVEQAGFAQDWKAAMDRSAACYRALIEGGFSAIAPYAVCMAYRVRFYMEMNAREAMHTIELRTAPAGHPSYRRVCQKMHDLISAQAGHKAIAAAMKYTDHGDVQLERLQAEVAAEKRRGQHLSDAG